MASSYIMNRTNSKIISKLEDIKTREIYLKKELDDIGAVEKNLLRKMNKQMSNDHALKRKAYKEIMHFTFNDFAQTTIGACVFSFAPFLDTDPWNFLPQINTSLLVSIHLFFVLCVMIATNYQFRNVLNLDVWFLKLLFKRVFYNYFSVFMVMTLILSLFNRLTYDLMLIDVLRNYLAIQTAGLFGAVTFSFIKK